MKPFALALLLSLCTFSCQSSQSITTVRLDMEDGTCSGTIVAPNVILTAAHCFQQEEDPGAFTTPPEALNTFLPFEERLYLAFAALPPGDR